MAEPKVRFKKDDGSSYPAWEVLPMSEVFTEVSEKNHPEIPVLSVQQGVGTVLRDASDRNILYDKSNLKNYKLMKKDDYIIHLRSFEGGLECSNYDGISSPAYRILRPKAILSAAYRDYFRSYDFIHNKLAVSVVGIRDGKNIDMDTFWQIPMSVPCLEEQQKIADFLSNVAEVIAACTKKVANLEAQKKAVMKKIFSQEVRFKRDDGSNFPEWEEKRIGDICKTYSGGTPKAGNDDYYGGSIPFIRSGEIHSDSTELYLTEEGMNNSSAKMVSVGDIIMALYGATSGEIDISKIEGAINQAILCIKPEDGFDRKFVVEVFRNYKDDILKTYLQGGQGNLSAQIVQGLTFEFPCIDEQLLIAEFLSDFDEAIETAKTELELWKELKKGLLQQMFV